MVVAVYPRSGWRADVDVETHMFNLEKNL
jgi:hypothetical protein